MIDSGADENFVSKTMAEQLRIRREPVKEEWDIVLPDGQNYTIKEIARGLKFIVQEYEGHADFFILPTAHDQVLLGHQWLAEVNPVINWKEREVRIKEGGEQFVLKVKRDKMLEEISLSQVNQILRRHRRSTTTAEEEDMFLLQVNQVEDQERQFYDKDREEIVDPELLSLLKEYQDIFKDELPVNEYIAREITHRIPLKEGARPVQLKQYPLSRENLIVVAETIVDLVRNGKIQRSTSPFRSPVLVVIKKDGKTRRVCIDPRPVNNITVDNMYPIPRPDVLMDQMHGSEFYTLIDLTDGYHHILIEEEDQHKTAFAVPAPSEYQGLWEWKCMPFGLKGAPATFQNYMDVVFQPYLGKFVVVYIDDVAVFSKTREEHLQHLRIVFETMRKHKVFAKRRKCFFMQKKIPYLGHYISKEGIETDPKKIKAIKNWPISMSVKQVRCFMGLAGYYRKFIRGFADLARP